METTFAGLAGALAPQGVMVLKVCIAAALGAVLGLEREKHDKPAGLRTNMLIAGGSALLVILGGVITASLDPELPAEALGVDPTRIIHAIIMGISFIGAGTILKSPGDQAVRNLTTAATLLFSAGAGMCVAMNLYLLAVCVTGLGLAINTLARTGERRS
jgi:putative Mg2+ transporter-C (MgtC) family protein